MKAINKKEKINILSIDDNFSNLVSFEDNKSVYEFSYNIDLKKARDKNFLTVLITVFKKRPKTQKSIFSSTSNNEIVKNILLFQASQKDIKNDNDKLIIYETLSDVTKAISNDFSHRKNKKKILNKKVFEVKNTEIPILQKNTFLTNFKNSSPLDYTNVSSILKSKIDPSEIILGKFINTFSISLSGKTRINKNGNENILSALLSNNQINNSSDLNSESVVQLATTVEEFSGKIKTEVIIAQKDLESSFSEFFVAFELKNSDGITVQKIFRSVSHANNIKQLQIPTIPPYVSFSPFSKISGKNKIFIKQLDSNAEKIKIYRKIINKNSLLQSSKYELVNSKDFALKKDESIYITDSINNGSEVIYRIIPVGAQNQVSSEFTNIVMPAFVSSEIKSKMDNEMEGARVVALVSDNSIKVQVLSIPPGVIAIKVLKRDLTIFEKDFTEIEHGSTGQKVFLTNNRFSGLFLDKDIKHSHIYEYVCSLIYKNGAERRSPYSDIIKYVPLNDILAEGSVSVSINKPRAITLPNNTFDVVFNIFSTLKDNTLDIVKKLLDREGLLEYFKTELTDEKAFFKKLLAYLVKRIDYTTGEVIHFNIITDEIFSDQNSQNINNISYIQSGHTYKYIVYPLLRSPETLFKNNIKTSTNLGGIETSYLPSKYFHPIIKRTGAIIEENVLKLNYAESEFEFGLVGNYAESDITISENTTKIDNPEVNKIANKKMSIRWQIFGNKENVDHFIIILNRLGQEEVIGKAHAIFDGNIIEYIHQLEGDEVGAIKYKILPVFKNYEYGSSILTEEIII